MVEAKAPEATVLTGKAARLAAKAGSLVPGLKLRRPPLGIANLSLARQFLLVSLAVVVVGGVAVAWLLGQLIETSAINRTTSVTALYVESFVAPKLQSLATSSTLTQDEIDALHTEHLAAPHLRAMQKALARDITTRVHSETDCAAAVEASAILFGEGTAESLKRLSESDLLGVFEGVPRFTIAKTELEKGIALIDLLAVSTAIFPSKGEAKRMIQNGGIFINKEKVADAAVPITMNALLNNRYIVVQKGKKNYSLVEVT